MIDFYFDTQNTRDGFLRNAINSRTGQWFYTEPRSSGYRFLTGRIKPEQLAEATRWYGLVPSVIEAMAQLGNVQIDSDMVYESPIDLLAGQKDWYRHEVQPRPWEWMPDDETELKTNQTSSMIEAMRQCLIDGVQPSVLRMFQQSHADTIDYREGMFQATDMHGIGYKEGFLRELDRSWKTTLGQDFLSWTDEKPELHGKTVGVEKTTFRDILADMAGNAAGRRTNLALLDLKGLRRPSIKRICQLLDMRSYIPGFLEYGPKLGAPSDLEALEMAWHDSIAREADAGWRRGLPPEERHLGICYSPRDNASLYAIPDTFGTRSFYQYRCRNIEIIVPIDHDWAMTLYEPSAMLVSHQNIQAAADRIARRHPDVPADKIELVKGHSEDISIFAASIFERKSLMLERSIADPRNHHLTPSELEELKAACPDATYKDVYQSLAMYVPIRQATGIENSAAIRAVLDQLSEEYRMPDQELEPGYRQAEHMQERTNEMER